MADGEDRRAVRALARPLREAGDLDPLLDRIGDARIVAVGEASHGTSEYYAWRAALTRRLIEERGFTVVAVEGDWPDCFRVNRSVRLRPGADDDPRDALDAFSRWPTWMWANDDVVEFCRWLRRHDADRGEQERAGFYGLDVYSLWDSMHELVAWLEEHEPGHVAQARRALACFEPYGEDGAEYAFAHSFSPTSCEDAAVEVLRSLCEDRGRQEAGTDAEARFSAEQNAAVVVDAERYYRAMVQGSAASWNVRDVHMVDVLDRLLEHTGGKVVVWAHNTHVGDARATDMASAGMVNVGQLLRERHGDDVVLVGLGGHRGSVIAGSEWGAQMIPMALPPARAGSLEALLHEAVGEDSLFVFPRGDRPGWLDRRLDHRAIGVVYRPERERWGNYVPTVLGDRYDAFIHLEETSALQPLHLERADEHVPPASEAV